MNTEYLENFPTFCHFPRVFFGPKLRLPLAARYETNNANLVIRLEGSDDAAADALAISAKEGKKKKAKG